jgi:hypothetical protein
MPRLLLAIWFGLLLHSFALDVTLKEVTATGGRLYEFSSDTGVDKRFSFRAHTSYSFELKLETWDLDIEQNDNGAPFEDYVEAIHASLKRLAQDAPGETVEHVSLYITEKSKMWAELKAKLLPIYKAAPGLAHVMPKKGNDILFDYVRHSKLTRQLAKDVADRLGMQIADLYLDADMEGVTFDREQSVGQPWKVLLQQPLFGIRPKSLEIVIVLKPK